MPRAVVIPAVEIDLGDVSEVQAALDAKASLSHSHISTDVSDATVIGRAILTGSDASAVRTTLGLPSFGPAASLAVGTTTGTVAAGDDSRITGAAQKSSNLADLSSAAAARTNLGLGGVATLSVGTTAGTVMAGDDSRLTSDPVRTVVYSGGAWPAVTTPRPSWVKITKWYSTGAGGAGAASPDAGDLYEGDIWYRHPDAV